MSDINVLSLFAGIGGLELGLERAGMTTVGQVEIDPWCRDVLARNWPEVPRHDDVRTTVAWWQSRDDRPPVHVVCGGFPCQPFSGLGLGLGMADERWGWPWMLDVVRGVRPRLVVVENVADLLRHPRAFGRVLGDLAGLGFDAEWGLLSACAMGAPHTRERLFVVAHRAGDDGEQPVHLPAAVPGRRAGAGAAGGDAGPVGWLPEPDVDRVAHGVPKRLVAPHLRGLGNAVVPQVAELVGRRALAHLTAGAAA